MADAINFFESTPIVALCQKRRFGGAGVYAIYYHGRFPLYLPLFRKNRRAFCLPIYVGKAVPSGWRQGRIISRTLTVLCGRLNEHVRSISQTKKMKPADFRCRFMILSGVESDLIVPVEAELIRRHIPLWNTVVDGFGNHDPGKGRYNQSKSEWDVLHPGRNWANRLNGPIPDRKNIIKKVNEFFKSF